MPRIFRHSLHENFTYQYITFFVLLAMLFLNIFYFFLLYEMVRIIIVLVKRIISEVTSSSSALSIFHTLHKKFTIPINRYANTIYDLYYNSKYLLFEFKFKLRITIEMYFIYRDCKFFMKCMKY